MDKFKLQVLKAIIEDVEGSIGWAEDIMGVNISEEQKNLTRSYESLSPTDEVLAIMFNCIDEDLLHIKHTNLWENELADSPKEYDPKVIEEARQQYLSLNELERKELANKFTLIIKDMEITG